MLPIAQFNYLWLWLNSHCPASMNQDSCQACKPYIITTCIADSNSCFSYSYTASDYNIGPVCAYSFCRLNVVEYFSNTVIWYLLEESEMFFTFHICFIFMHVCMRSLLNFSYLLYMYACMYVCMCLTFHICFIFMYVCMYL
jgi:hypothetical protein